MIVAIMTTALSGTAWADTKTEGFETATAGSNYQGTVTLSSNESDCGIGWEIYYGCVSTSSKITGNNSAALRLYTSNNYGYLKTTTPIDGLSNVTFNAKAATSNSASIKIDIKYSSDGSTWNNIETGKSLTTSSASYSVDIPSGGKYFQIAISSSSTKPSSKNAQLTIDDVVFTSTSGSSAVATTTTIDATGIANTDVYVNTAAGSLSASVTAGGSAVDGATVTWSGNNNSVATIDPSTGVVTLVGAGTVTFTARYAGVSGEYQASSATYEMTVTSSAPDYTTLPFEWAGGTPTNFAAQAGCSVYGADVYSSQETYQIKLDGTGDYIQVKTDSQPGKVTIGVKMVGGGNTSTITVQESADGETFTDVQSLTISGAQNNVLTLETTNDFAATSRYVRLYFTKGSNVGVGPISIALPSNDPVISAEDASIAYNTTSGSIEYEIVHPVEGGTISASTDAAWLTFGSTGTAYTAEENTNISARVANVTLTYTYNTSQTVTKEITLTQSGDPNAPGTENNPYTVAEARAAIDAGTGVTGVYATGIVSEIVEAYSSQYHNISYNISADGLTTSDQLEIYRGKSFNGDNFTSENDIQVGDEVVVYGNLIKYENTYEFAQNSQLVSLEREKQDPTIPSTPVSVAYGSTHTVTGIVAGEATLTSSNTAVATVEGLVITPVAVGTTTITVTTAENTYYNAGNGTFELTVTAPVGGTTAPTGSAAATIFEETFAECAGTGEAGSFSGTSNDAIQSDVSGWTFVKANAANGCGKFGSSSADGSATTPEISVVNGNTYTLTFKAAPWNAESETAMNVTVEGGTITGINTDAMTIQVWNEYEATITATSTSVKITFAASAHRFFLDDVKVEAPATPAPAITATLNGSGYATFCSEYPLDFSEVTDFSAWQITGISSSNEITFEQVTGSVKGGTGLFLKGEAGATVTIPSVDSETVLSGNKLVGTLAPMYFTANQIYGLAGATFKKNTAGSIRANKAYIPANLITVSGGEAKAFTFIFEDDATGIKTIETVSAEEAAQIFNLAGQRINKMQKGINIVNGKKILK